MKTWFLVWMILGEPVYTSMPSYQSCVEEARSWPGAWCEKRVEQPKKVKWFQ